MRPAPVFGPSLLFSGQAARWAGDGGGVSPRDRVGVKARVTFEGFASQRVTSHLHIVNDGTTAVYYDWKVTRSTPNKKEEQFAFLFARHGAEQSFRADRQVH